MQTTAKITELNIDYNTRKPKISLILDTNDINVIEELKNENKLNLELKKHREKRSLNANAYFWKLLTEYAEEKQVDTITEYKERVKRLGIFRQFKIESKDVNTFKIIWQERGIAWFCEINDTEYIGNTEFKIINAYYGSSSFNTKQMSRLIDDLVEDCKQVGLETLTPQELSILKENWK